MSPFQYLSAYLPSYFFINKALNEVYIGTKGTKVYRYVNVIYDIIYLGRDLGAACFIYLTTHTLNVSISISFRRQKNI